MNIVYEDDKMLKGGHGNLVFSEIPLSGKPVSFAIMRASDHQYAAGRLNTWVGEKVFLPITQNTGADGALYVAIGPDLVDSLDSQETYAVFLKDENGAEKRGLLKIKQITYSPITPLDNTGSMREEELEESAPPINTVVPENAEPEKVAEEPAPEVQDDKIDMPEAREEKKTGARAWRWIILALLVLGCVAWFLLDPRKDEPTTPANENPRQEEAKNPAKQPQKPAPQAQDNKPRIHFDGREITPAEAAQMSRDMPRATKTQQDAIYRLYYFAARYDEPSVLMQYGACLDPSKPDWGTIGKDAVLAYEAYARAKAKYPEEAQKAMRDLARWLEDNARRDNQAKIWLADVLKIQGK